MSHKSPRPLHLKQRQVAECLAKGRDISELAYAFRVRRETISRWKTQPLFQQEMDKHRQEMHALAMERLPQLLDATILALASELGSSKNRGKVALGLLKLFGAERLVEAAAPKRLGISAEIITNP